MASATMSTLLRSLRTTAIANTSSSASLASIISELSDTSLLSFYWSESAHGNYIMQKQQLQNIEDSCGVLCLPPSSASPTICMEDALLMKDLANAASTLMCISEAEYAVQAFFLPYHGNIDDARGDINGESAFIGRLQRGFGLNAAMFLPPEDIVASEHWMNEQVEELDVLTDNTVEEYMRSHWIPCEDEGAGGDKLKRLENSLHALGLHGQRLLRCGGAGRFNPRIIIYAGVMKSGNMAGLITGEVET